MIYVTIKSKRILLVVSRMHDAAISYTSVERERAKEAAQVEQRLAGMLLPIKVW